MAKRGSPRMAGCRFDQVLISFLSTAAFTVAMAAAAARVTVDDEVSGVDYGIARRRR